MEFKKFIAVFILLLTCFSVFGSNVRLFYQNQAKTDIYTEESNARLNLPRLAVTTNFDLFGDQTVTSVSTGTLNNSALVTQGYVDDAITTAIAGVPVYTSPLTTDGDLFIYNSGDARLAIGTENQVLTVNASGFPEWKNSSGGSGGGITTYADLTAAEAATCSADDQAYVTSLESFYRCDDSGSFTADSMYVLNTGSGASVKWLAVAGKYVKIREFGGGFVVGKNAGSSTTESNNNRNVLVGESSGANITTGAANNIGLGFNSLLSLLTGDNNIAIGEGALDLVTTGSDNIAIGYYAGRRTGTLNNRLIIDNFFGRADATEESNKAIVYGLMDSDPANQDLYFNADVDVRGTFTVNGSSVNVVNFDPQDNLFILPDDVGTPDLTTAQKNFFLGIYDNDLELSTGIFNTCIGEKACSKLATGVQNTAIGYLAYEISSNGNFNTYIGQGAGQTVAGYSQNVGIGFNANRHGGGNNTAIGTQALNGSNGFTASNMIGIGYRAGWQSNTSGSLFFDSYVRTDDADQRKNAIIYGQMSGDGANEQELSLNAHVKPDRLDGINRNIFYEDAAEFDNSPTWTGTLTNTSFAYSETNPLMGEGKYTFTNALSSDGEFKCTEEINVPEGHRGSLLGITFLGKYSGTTDALKVYIEGEGVDSNTDLYIQNSDRGIIYQALTNSTTNTATLSLCTEVVTSEAATLDIDNIVAERVIYPKVNINNTETTEIVQTGDDFTNRVDELEWNLSSNITIERNGNELITPTDDSSNTRTKFIANKAVHVTVSFGGPVNATDSSYIRKYNSNGTLVRTWKSTTINVSTYDSRVTAPIYLKAGEFFTIDVPSDIVNSSTREYVLSYTAKENIQSLVVTNEDTTLDSYFIDQDTSALTDGTGELQYNLSTATIEDDSNGTIKVENDSGNTRTKFFCTRPCSLSISSSAKVGNYRGLGILKNDSVIMSGGSAGPVTLNYSNPATTVELNGTTDYLTIGITNTDGLLSPSSAVSSGAFPVRTKIQVYTAPKLLALPSSEENNYDVAVSAAGVLSNFNGATNWVTFVSYSSGVYTYDLNTDIFTEFPLITAEPVGANRLEGVTYGTFPRFTVDWENAAGSPVSVSHQLEAKKRGVDRNGGKVYVGKMARVETCYIKDIKTANTSGGTCSSGSWITRTLNNLEGNCTWLTLSSNQITLPVGKYEIEASSPTYNTNRAQNRIANITDSTYTYGSSAYASSAAPNGHVILKAYAGFTLEDEKTLEIQQRCETSHSSRGLGIEADFGTEEVYTQVKITRIK